MKKLIFTILILTSWNSKPAYCLCAAPVSAKENLKNASAVFLGTIISIKPLEKPLEIWEGNIAKTSLVTFNIEKYWKGKIEKTFSIHISTGDSTFSKSKRYLIYAREYGRKKLVGVFDCNEPVPDGPKLAEDLKELGPGKTP